MAIKFFEADMDDTVTCALSGMFIAVCAAIGKDRSEMAAQIIRSAATNPQTEANEARIYSAIAEDFDCVFNRGGSARAIAH